MAIFQCYDFFKDWATPASYHLFSPHHTENYFNGQQDLNSDHWNSRPSSVPLLGLETGMLRVEKWYW